MKESFYLFIQAIIYIFTILVGGAFMLGMCFIWLIFAVIVLVVDFCLDLFNNIKTLGKTR